ncbi:MAG: MgtC/SapB family protein [Spirochaetaceae bacterium]
MLVWMRGLLTATDVVLPVTIFRLLVVFLLAGAIGVERERSNQPAGLRTHILIGLGATLIMLLSIHVPQTLMAGDPARLAAQVVSGIGFLGGGAILRLGADIRGLTTAASIWTVAAIGLAVGAGLYGGALTATVLILMALTLLDRFERKYFPKRIIKSLNIATTSKKAQAYVLEGVLEDVGIRIRSTDVMRSLEKGYTRYRFLVYVPPDLDYDQMYEVLNEVPGVTKIRLEDVG